jgi:hypothetical protein
LHCSRNCTVHWTVQNDALFMNSTRKLHCSC